MASKGGRQKDLEAREQQRRLSKTELLHPHFVEKEITIEELGGTVLIRSLSHKQRRELQAKSKFGTEEFDDDLMTLLGIIESVIDPKLTEQDLEDFAKQGTGIIDKLSLEISLLNMMGGTKDLGKDLGPILNSVSG